MWFAERRGQKFHYKSQSRSYHSALLPHSQVIPSICCSPHAIILAHRAEWAAASTWHRAVSTTCRFFCICSQKPRFSGGIAWGHPAPSPNSNASTAPILCFPEARWWAQASLPTSIALSVALGLPWHALKGWLCPSGNSPLPKWKSYPSSKQLNLVEKVASSFSLQFKCLSPQSSPKQVSVSISVEVNRSNPTGMLTRESPPSLPCFKCGSKGRWAQWEQVCVFPACALCSVQLSLLYPLCLTDKDGQCAPLRASRWGMRPIVTQPWAGPPQPSSDTHDHKDTKRREGEGLTGGYVTGDTQV